MAENNCITPNEEDFGDELYKEPFASEAFSPPNHVPMDEEADDCVEVVGDGQGGSEGEPGPPGVEVEAAEEPEAAEVPEDGEDSGNRERKDELEKRTVTKTKPTPERNQQVGTQQADQRKDKGYQLFQKHEGPVVNGGVRKLIELKGNLKLKARVRDPIKRISEDKSPCCFAPVKRGFYLHFRTCVAAKTSIWLGNGAQRVKAPYLTMLNHDPEEVLRPTLLSNGLMGLAAEIIKVTHQCESELEILWGSFGTTRCHQSCIREECLRMASCLSVLMRSGVSINHYKDLGTLDEVWDRAPNVGKRMIHRMEEAAQQNLVFQISCSDPYVVSPACHATSLRRQSSKLLKRYRDKESELRGKFERLNEMGLDHLRVSVFDALMYGLNRNVQRAEQLFWNASMRRYVLKIQNRRYLNIFGLTRDESPGVPTLEEGYSSALNLEAPAGRPGGGRTSGEVNQGPDDLVEVDEGVDQPALTVPWNAEYGHKGDQGRSHSPRGDRGGHQRSERRTTDLRDHIKQKERRQ